MVLAGKRTSPLITGILPREDIAHFLEHAVVPSFWPSTRLSSFQLARSRFSPGDECAGIATLKLEPAPAEAPRVVITFADKDDLHDAIKAHKDGYGVRVYNARVYSPDLGCIAEVFPSDWRMLSLRSAMSPEYMLPLVRQATGLTSHADALDVRLLRYRPHSRAVIMYTARDAQGDVLAEAVGKVYRSEGKAKRQWRILESVFVRTAVAPIVPRPLDLQKESALLLMSKAPGRSLQAILNDPRGSDLRHMMRLAARALHSFHATSPGDLKLRKLSKDVDDWKDAVKRTKAKRVHGLDVESLVQTLKQRAELISKPVMPVLMHGGFKPSALMVEGDQTVFVDLDAVSAGDPARDVGCFTAKLRALSLTPGHEHFATLADDFVHEYALDLGSGDLIERARFYEAVFLTLMGLKHINTSWRGEEEDAPAFALLDAARTSLRLSYP